jgi:hypothetical protein
MTKSAMNARTRITMTLPTFVVCVLQRRAKEQRISVSAVVETLMLDHILIDEVERLMKQSPEFKRIAMEWMRNAMPRKKS